MGRTTLARALLGAVLLAFLSQASSAAVLTWNLDSSLSYLQLAVPTQPVKAGGTPSGNAFFTNQGVNSGSWTIGNQAAMSGSISTDFDEGSSIKFRAGEHILSALNSGNYAPDFATWNSGTETYSPPNQLAPAAYGGQIGTTQAGVLLVVVNDAVRFAIRDISYDLSSADIPLVANQFAANQTTFGMSDGDAGLRGNATFGVPSDLGTLVETGISVNGANVAALGTITTPDPMQPNLRKLTLPITIPITLNLFDGWLSTLNGTATGEIVAFAMVPEPSSLVLGGAALAIGLVAVIRRRRNFR